MVKPVIIVLCPECGTSFTPRRGSRFCCKEHQATFNNRAAAEGKVIIALAKAWAAGRGGGHTPAHPISGPAMREMTQILRRFNATDKVAGRPSPTLYAETLLRQSIYLDRTRK